MFRSFYDVLQVDQNATLDEIKLAFKRRALQVHPDKGGSKEAFHLVYQALETLTDPEARKSYDHRLSSKSTSFPSGVRRQKRAKTTAHSQAETTRKSGSSRFESGCYAKYSAWSRSKQTQFMRRIHDLLKKLPRDFRNEVITQNFSQKQRLALEKWMVDTSSLTPVDQNQDRQSKHVASDAPREAREETGEVTTVAAKVSRRKPRERRRKSFDRTSCSSFSTRRVCGSIRKNRSTGQGGSYVAVLRFDAVHIEMWTAKCDLSTALEYLLLLTPVKQKMLDVGCGPAVDAWEDRLQAALVSSAREQGKQYSDFGVRFCLVYSFRFFIGSQEFRSPTVRSVQELGQFRRCLEQFRETKNRGRGSIYWCHSPTELKEMWERFLKAVAETWQACGIDSSSFLAQSPLHLHGMVFGYVPK